MTELAIPDVSGCEGWTYRQLADAARAAVASASEAAWTVGKLADACTARHPARLADLADAAGLALHTVQNMRSVYRAWSWLDDSRRRELSYGVLDALAGVNGAGTILATRKRWTVREAREAAAEAREEDRRGRAALAASASSGGLQDNSTAPAGGQEAPRGPESVSKPPEGPALPETPDSQPEATDTGERDEDAPPEGASFRDSWRNVRKRLRATETKLASAQALIAELTAERDEARRDAAEWRRRALAHDCAGPGCEACAWHEDHEAPADPFAAPYAGRSA